LNSNIRPIFEYSNIQVLGPIPTVNQYAYIFELSFRLLQEAQDIFGVDFDFDEFKEYDGEESEEEEEDEVREHQISKHE